MANALRREAMVPVEQVIHDLETAKGRPDAALRNALPHAAEITPLVIELVEKAADGVYLIPRQETCCSGASMSWPQPGAPSSTSRCCA